MSEYPPASEQSLRGKAALITGAGVRIGRATALTLAREGVDIIVHYNNSEQPATELCQEIRQLGVSAWPVQADFNKPPDVEQLIDRSIKAAGRLDILINNASIFPQDRLADITWADLESNIQVNAWTPFVLCRQFAQRVKRGQIINMHDSRLAGYDWTHVAYILSKHLLAAMTRMMAVEFAPGITVNAVSPGLILPPPGQDESYIQRLIGTVPLKKHGDPQDIADAIAFLLRSDFITGQVIYVDGGRHLKEYADGPHPH